MQGERHALLRILGCGSVQVQVTHRLWAVAPHTTPDLVNTHSALWLKVPLWLRCPERQAVHFW